MARLALLVPGGHGQLGSDVARALSGARKNLVHTPSSAELDVSDATAVSDAVRSFAGTAKESKLRPVVLNAAAYTAVDKAESDPERAAEINTRGAAAVAEACRANDVPLVHVSTDYVFSGEATRPYEPDDETGPRTVYGRTKLDGERAVLASEARAWIVRTAWLYGATGANFVKTMARLQAERETLTVVDDQIGSPTWSRDLAQGLLDLADRVAQRRGPELTVLHYTNAGQTSWYEFARAVFEELGADPERVRPCTSAEFPTAAPRPAYSALSGHAWEAADLKLRPDWRDALTAAFAADGAALRG